MAKLQLVVDRTWDGDPALPGERVQLDVRLTDEALAIEVSAPFHGDPAPPGPAGALDGLWEHEVVEIFVLGDGERYTEIELGPYGHHLVLQLDGVRNAVARCLPLTFAARQTGDRWLGRASLDRSWLPAGALRVNAYAIHGIGPERRYLAMTPVPGPHPDFHRIGVFEVPLAAHRDSPHG